MAAQCLEGAAGQSWKVVGAGREGPVEGQAGERKEEGQKADRKVGRRPSG